MPQFGEVANLDPEFDGESAEVIPMIFLPEAGIGTEGEVFTECEEIVA